MFSVIESCSSLLLGCAGLSAALLGCSPVEPGSAQWLSTSEASVTVEYHARDDSLAPQVQRWALAGRVTAQTFFGQALDRPFTIRLYPDRATMEPEWRVVFNAPGMVFQCWMIANASASQVLVLSPRVWAAEACGHNGADTVHIRRVLAHEIIHVLHRNLNAEPGLPGLQSSWWLAEGLATLGSGQFDAAMRAQAADAIRRAPRTQLEQVLTGTEAYALAAALVDYIDATFERTMLVNLMRARDEAGILLLLGQSEAELLQRWQEYATGR